MMKKWLAMVVVACLAGSVSAVEYSWWGAGFGGDGVTFNSASNWASPWATQATVLPGSNDLTRIQAAAWMSGYPTLSGSATLGGLFLGLDHADHTPDASLTITDTGSLSTVTNTSLATPYNPGVQIGWYSDASVTSAGTVDTGPGVTALGAGDVANDWGDAVLTITDGSWTTAGLNYNSNSVNHVQLDGGTLTIWSISGMHEANQTMDITGGTLLFHTTDTNWFGWAKTIGLTGYGSPDSLTGHHDGNTWIVTAFGAAPTPESRGDSIFLFNTNASSAVAGFWALAANDGAAAPVHPITSYVLYNDANLTPTPNIPMVGDVNGDGITDVAIRGKNTNNDTLILGRNTGITNIAGVAEGTLVTSIGTSGWAEAPDGNWAPFWYNFAPNPDYTHYFIADIDADGHDDAVGVRPTPWDTGATTYFVAYHADAEGLEGHTPVTTWAAGILNPHAANTPLMGDFNGDGAIDAAQQNNSTALVNGMVSIPGTGLSAGQPTFWGNIGGFAANHVATLVGDINGDGLDDIVQVDDRNSNGSWTWVTGLTGTNVAIPAGFEIALGGATSWASPFTLDPNSISATPLLADMDNDGRDDLVLFEEYYTDTAQTNIWGRLLTSLTDDPAGGLFSNAFDFGSWYDYVALFGVDASGMFPSVGNVHPAEELTYYAEWALGYGLTDIDTTAGLSFDFELDGLDNLAEYALGGNPLVDDAATYGPVTTSLDTDNWDYVYRRRVDAASRDLAYDLQYDEDLVAAPGWTSTGGAFESGIGAIDAEFEAVTNSAPITGMDELFLNLEITGSF